MKIKKFTVICLCFLLCANSILAEEKITIAVNQFISHIALDNAYDGLHEGLKDQGIIPDKANIIFGNAQGNISNSVQISKHQASYTPKFMIAIATPAAQTNLKAKHKNTILAFLAVTDPKSAGLYERDDVIGVTDIPPIEELIDKALVIMPNTKTIGVIFNSGEVNSIKTIEILEPILKKHNVELKKASVTNSSGIKDAFTKLAGAVDIIYLPQDNSVISSLDNLAAMSKSSSLPLIASDPTLVDRGVFLALGANYFKSGQQLANMIANIIEGKEIEPKIQNAAIKELKINYRLANEMNVEIPKNMELEVKK
jgi:putative ABC transport system substrate-binding protein